MMKNNVSGKMKVMVVDDESNIALALKLIVSSNFDCEKVDTADDGQEAWERLQQEDYDLVLSDWNMPRMDGNQLLKMMRQTEKTKNTAFLMLTVRKDVESVASAVKAGVTDYVIKPFDKAVLIQRIEKLVGRKASTPAMPAKREPAAAPGAMDKKAISMKVMELIGKGDITLPAMPQVIFAIEDILKNEDADVKDLSEAIALDAGISSKLIGVANSVMYRGVKECTMVEEAIMRLGMKETKELVYLISNRNLFALKDRRYEETIKTLYIHSIACGAVSQSLARLLSVPDSHNFFAMGLLHDIGKLLVLKVLSEITKDMHGLDLTAALSIMDTLHAKVGYMLLSKWEFPQIYSMVALNHDNTTITEIPDKELLVVYFANFYTRKMGYSLIPDDGTDYINGQTAKQLGVNSEIMETVTREAKEHVDKVLSIM